MKPQAFFSLHAVFTYEEFVAALGSGGRSKRTRDTLLAYYVKMGRLINVRRGLYITVPDGIDPAHCPVDPFLVAGKMAADAVLAYHTALEFHGRAHSVWHQFTCLTARRSRPLAFRGQRFNAVPFPGILRRMRSEMLGVKPGEQIGVSVRVTGFERGPVS